MHDLHFPPMVSETDLEALLRVSWADSMKPLPWLSASPLPPLTVSAAFWPVDFDSSGWTDPATLS